MAGMAESPRNSVLHTSLLNLTKEVDRIAGMMERLIQVEERNNQMNERIGFLKQTFEKDVVLIQEELKDQKGKLEKVMKFMYWMAGVGAVAMLIIEPLIVIIVGKMF